MISLAAHTFIHKVINHLKELILRVIRPQYVQNASSFSIFRIDTMLNLEKASPFLC